MKVIFMGTPEFSVTTLEEMIKAGHEVLAVITQPDKPKGRGKAVQFSAVKEKALEKNLKVYQPVKVREPEFIEFLKKLEPDVIVVVAFGQILPKAILDIPKYGCVNVHASLLPKYRGAAPIQWAVINGEKESGVTTMFMDTGLDTGDILLKKKVPLEEKETSGSLHDKLSAVGAALLIQTLNGLEQGTIRREKQDDSQSCYARMLEKSSGKIDWGKDAASIERLVRGLNPWPSAFTSMGGRTMKIWDARVIEKEYEGRTGEIVEVTKSSIIVKTGKDALAIDSLQLEGKKRMTADAFLRGYSVEKGCILC
jgi:methionyl-tRNA formyltransferase